MKIGILAVDSKQPNYALMKVSAYWKQQNADVELYSKDHYYDAVYISKIFTFTKDVGEIENADAVFKGGTGYDIKGQLPKEIDDMQPDYDIFNVDKRTAIGFLSRGCVNKCKWCVVPIKEGYITPYRDISQIAVNGRDHITLFDNNVLASDYGLQQLDKIAQLGVWVDFNQGLDARKIDLEVAKLLANCKWLNYIRMAADTSSQIQPVRDAVKLLRQCGYKKDVFVYALLNSDFKESYNRIIELRKIDPKLQPFAQPYRDFVNNTDPQKWQKDLARWVNCKWIFRSCDFSEYQPRKNFSCKTYIETL